MYEFKSVFKEHIENLITLKRQSGFSYKHNEYIYKLFDDFCIELNYQNSFITSELLHKWALLRPTEGINYRNQRVSMVRILSTYINSLGIPSYIPKTFPSEKVSIARVLNDDEIKAFFEKLDAKYRLSKPEFLIIFRLYYCCGMRLSEVINLKKEHVNLSTGAIEIYQSKGPKDRLIYVNENLLLMMNNYWNDISKKIINSTYFFSNRKTNLAFIKTYMCKIFSMIWNQTRFYQNEFKKPTIHSLRHTFVVNIINKWIKDKVDVNAMLPYLSSYLGHTSPSETFYYYHSVNKALNFIRQADESIDIIPEEIKHE